MLVPSCTATCRARSGNGRRVILLQNEGWLQGRARLWPERPLLCHTMPWVDGSCSAMCNGCQLGYCWHGSAPLICPSRGSCRALTQHVLDCKTGNLKSSWLCWHCCTTANCADQLPHDCPAALATNLQNRVSLHYQPCYLRSPASHFRRCSADSPTNSRKTHNSHTLAQHMVQPRVSTTCQCHLPEPGPRKN